MKINFWCQSLSIEFVVIISGSTLLWSSSFVPPEPSVASRICILIKSFWTLFVTRIWKYGQIESRSCTQCFHSGGGVSFVSLRCLVLETSGVSVSSCLTNVYRFTLVFSACARQARHLVRDSTFSAFCILGLLRWKGLIRSPFLVPIPSILDLFFLFFVPLPWSFPVEVCFSAFFLDSYALYTDLRAWMRKSRSYPTAYILAMKYDKCLT